MQLAQDALEGKITKEEALAKKDWIMDPDRKF